MKVATKLRLHQYLQFFRVYVFDTSVFIIRNLLFVTVREFKILLLT